MAIAETVKCHFCGHWVRGQVVPMVAPRELHSTFCSRTLCMLRASYIYHQHIPVDQMELCQGDPCHKKLPFTSHLRKGQHGQSPRMVGLRVQLWKEEVIHTFKMFRASPAELNLYSHHPGMNQNLPLWSLIGILQLSSSNTQTTRNVLLTVSVTRKSYINKMQWLMYP